MNLNLSIERMILDGIDLAPGQSRLLRRTLASQLTTILTEQARGEPRFALNDRADGRGRNSIQVGPNVDTSSLSPQLANVISSNIFQSQFGPSATNGGQS